LTPPQPGGGAVLPRVLLLGFVAAIAVGGWIATCVLWRYQGAMEEIGVLELRRFEAPTLVVLGSGAARENPARFGPALAVGAGEHVVLVDAGRGVAEGLRRARISVSQPDAVLLSSLLPENVVGLDDLASVRFRDRRAKALRVIGPPGTRALVGALSEAHAGGIAALAAELDLPREGAALEAEEIAGDWTGRAGDLALRAVPLGGGPWPALAWRVDAAQRSVALVSTAFASERSASLAEGASTLVAGAFFDPAVKAALEAGVPDAARIEREAALQLSLGDAARLAARAGAGRLVLVRLQPPPLFHFQFERAAGESYAGEVVVAEDGDEIEL
jgi:ribonuclease BN (tRNA processing enzyme)